jgi:hypothetical protein
MDILQFNKLRKILEQNQKFVITKDNLGEKSLELTNNFMQYYDQYIVEYKVLQDMLTGKQKLYSELYNKYRYDNKLEARTKTEVEPFIYSDESYYRISLAVNDQEMIVKYFEGLCDMIKRLSYNIKNIIELKNLGMQV